MKPPIILNANGDFYVYETLEEAERDIERADVINGIYRVYDSDGLVLTPVVVNDTRFDGVRISPTNELRPSELRASLVDFLDELNGESDTRKTISLKEAVAALRDKFRL